MKKVLLSILFISIALSTILMGVISWSYQLIVTILVFYLIQIIILKTPIFKNKVKFSLIVFLPIIIAYGVGLIYEDDILHVLPIYLFMVITPVLTFFLYKINFVKSFVLVLIICFVGFVFMENWLIFSFKREMNPYTFPELNISMLDSNSKQDFEIEEGNAYVIDLWTTSCRNCIEDFPKFEKLKLDYKHNDEIKFYTLNLPMPNDNIDNVIKYTHKYDFGKLIGDDRKLAEKGFGINKYPNYVVVNRNKEIIYVGWLNEKWYDFYNNIHYLLKKV